MALWHLYVQQWSVETIIIYILDILLSYFILSKVFSFLAGAFVFLASGSPSWGLQSGK